MMRNLYSKLLPILAIVLVTGACNNGNKEEEFTKLFNGENWDGWYLKIRSGDEALTEKVFAIEDGLVHVFNDNFPDTINLSTGKNDTHGLFYTTRKFSRFILRFEYKWGTKIANNFDQWQYDAGCYYHVYNDKIWPKGIEYQIRYDHTQDKNHTGDFWASDSLTWYTTEDGNSFLSLQNGGKIAPNRKGELLASAQTTHNALNNKWNKCEVIVMSDKYVIHKLNGELVNMATDLPSSEGIIGFQSETAEIFYRNIEIKEFDKDIPIDEFGVEL